MPCGVGTAQLLVRVFTPRHAETANNYPHSTTAPVHEFQHCHGRFRMSKTSISRFHAGITGLSAVHDEIQLHSLTGSRRGCIGGHRRNVRRVRPHNQRFRPSGGSDDVPPGPGSGGSGRRRLRQRRLRVRRRQRRTGRRFGWHWLHTDAKRHRLWFGRHERRPRWTAWWQRLPSGCRLRQRPRIAPTASRGSYSPPAADDPGNSWSRPTALGA
jgi:hypothetical protein